MMTQTLESVIVVGMTDLLTTQQAAKRLKLNSASTLRHAIRRGELKAEKVGRDWMIDPADLDAWAKEHTPKPRAKHQNKKD